MQFYIHLSTDISIYVLIYTLLYVYLLHYSKLDNKHTILIDSYLERTSLHWAAREGQTDIVELLLDHGANISTKDSQGKKHKNT